MSSCDACRRANLGRRDDRENEETRLECEGKEELKFITIIVQVSSICVYIILLILSFLCCLRSERKSFYMIALYSCRIV